LQQRQQDPDELRVELLHLFSQILVRVLLRLSVQPDDLGPVKDVELAKVVGSAINFRDVTDVRTFVVQRAQQTDVEIRSQDRTDKTTENKFGEVAITGTDLALGRNEVE
jgi:hypothetical protein